MGLSFRDFPGRRWDVTLLLIFAQGNACVVELCCYS
jgi:hypothetical protein